MGMANLLNKVMACCHLLMGCPCVGILLSADHGGEGMKREGPLACASREDGGEFCSCMVEFIRSRRDLLLQLWPGEAAARRQAWECILGGSSDVDFDGRKAATPALDASIKRD
jgi:hypothetical protein